MAKPLSALRAERSTARPERPYKVIVGDGQKYVAEIARLSAEHDELVSAPAPIDADGENKPPRKMAAPKYDPRVYEIRERLAGLAKLLQEYEGELLISATVSDGEWEQWRLEHPAREEGEAGYRDDMMLARGQCNIEDLMADIARYVTAWEGEPLAPGDFDALNLLRPDKKAIAAIVVGLYEFGDDLPKWRSDLSALLKSGPSLSSPATSGSPRSDSSDGPLPNATSTTTPTES